jgi:hypothetical protein
MNWSTERDALIAQTLAFVQSVTGKTSDAAVEIVTAKAASVGPTSAGPASIARVPGLSAPTTDNPVTNSVQVEQNSEPPPASVFPGNDIRKEFQNRIAAFQAHQHRFHREREAYFNSVLTKVRAVLENGGEMSPP